MSNRQTRRQSTRNLSRNSTATADQITPVRIKTKTDEEREAVKKVPIFYIDDVEYTVPESFPPTYGLRYLRESAEDGQDTAVYNLMVDVLGEEAYDDLCRCDDIEQDQMDQIVEMVVKLALGAVDKGKG